MGKTHRSVLINYGHRNTCQEPFRIRSLARKYQL